MLMSDVGEEDEGLHVALGVVRKKMRVPPAGRGEEKGGLPGYGEGRGSVGVLGGPALQERRASPSARARRREKAREVAAERDMAAATAGA